ncbi:MAG: hypothetical protein U9N86_03865 [Bacteroidota bacterium]|nr:hypothetical protein [Bacteroidota bacterium]
MKIKTGLIVCLLAVFTTLNAQDFLSPTPPILKGYKGKEGRIIKNHYFNFIKVKDESGDKDRQSTGHYWEISYVYDSVFRQKGIFEEFMTKQITDAGGILFWKDTSMIHFAIPRETGGNLWGNVILTSDKVYRLKLIEERVFVNKLVFDSIQNPMYDDFVVEVELPPRFNLLPNTLITQTRYSKFNHLNITFVKNQQSYRQTLMGPYWNLKLKVVKDEGDTDKRVSPVEIMESYYRATLKAGGEIIKSRPRELIFFLPVEDEKKLWVRVMTSLDGVYFIRMVLQDKKDETPALSVSEISRQGKG